jgi:hypothetical protein
MTILSSVQNRNPEDGDYKKHRVSIHRNLLQQETNLYDQRRLPTTDEAFKLLSEHLAQASLDHFQGLRPWSLSLFGSS